MKKKPKNTLYMINGDKLLKCIKNNNLSSFFSGDISFSRGFDKNIRMPYLTLNEICYIGKRVLKNETDYSNCVRVDVMNAMLTLAISQNQFDDMLTFLFAKEQFKSYINSRNPDIINEEYIYLSDLLLEKLNSFLYFDELKAIRVNDKFIIINFDEALEKKYILTGNNLDIVNSWVNFQMLTNLLLFSKSKEEALSWISVINSIDYFPRELMNQIKEKYNLNDQFSIPVVADELNKLFMKTSS